MRRRSLLSFVCCMFGAAVLTGCGDGSETAEARLKAVNPSNIFRLTNLYTAFAREHGGVGPKDEKEFRDFIVGIGPERLGRIGVDPNAIDALFTSERDSQPFIIHYGKSGQDSRSGGPADKGGVKGVAVVLEKTGVDGMRKAGFLGTREVKDLDASQAAAFE